MKKMWMQNIVHSPIVDDEKIFRWMAIEFGNFLSGEAVVSCAARWNECHGISRTLILIFMSKVLVCTYMYRPTGLNLNRTTLYY